MTMSAHDTISVLLEFRSGISGTLAAVRSTPAFWRVHVFGRDGSAEALGRTELVLRRSGKEPEHLRFPNVDSVRANLDATATRFICVRYGNVLASRGSVIPLFHEQIRRGGKVRNLG